MKSMLAALSLGLFGSLFGSSAFAAAQGHVWEFGKFVAGPNVTLIVQLDLRAQRNMIANVTCFANDTGEVATVSTEGSVKYVNNQIINNGAAETKNAVPFNGRTCSAVIPAGRVMTFQVIDDNHLSVIGDPFFADPTIWTKVQ